jgi:hypothetical protein
MKKLIGCLLITLSAIAYAKQENVMCCGATGPDFLNGDGSAENPYLICNKAQLNRLSNEAGLLVSNFILGNDLDYTGTPFSAIGTPASPFQGSFDGDGYTLKNVTIANVAKRYSYYGIFGYTVNSTIKNLLVDGLANSGLLGSYIGGLIGEAHFTTVNNVRISNLNIKTPDYSGGLIGAAYDSTITTTGVQGQINQTSGSDGNGGFIGSAYRTNISSSYSKVKVRQGDTSSYGVSYTGGFMGLISDGQVSDCYALGDIDYSRATDPRPWNPNGIAGFIATISNSVVSNAFHAGKFINVEANDLGGAASYVGGSTVANLFWDVTLSGIANSAAGTGATTTNMQTASFWISQGFDPSRWTLVNGSYPKLKWE